ncbi:hypothetical protein K443DRAFT_292444 [Laccaria amethystina LaAM-08-1]|uniref:Uncharacterized protein n=1 Tax=Laccaria amethystina LaAM-08-1 TaxID=1095629 RepID=A0A0C9XJ49_9AGAR|nr:hypothetical protein K443DRAFT_292444 [Laccaria amethystina LaAM-08-1]
MPGHEGVLGDPLPNPVAKITCLTVNVRISPLPRVTDTGGGSLSIDVMFHDNHTFNSKISAGRYHVGLPSRLQHRLATSVETRESIRYPSNHHSPSLLVPPVPRKCQGVFNLALSNPLCPTPTMSTVGSPSLNSLSLRLCSSHHP